MTTMALTELQAKERELREELHRVVLEIDTRKVKCATCRCRILPGRSCRCCADYGETETQPEPPEGNDGAP